jgi:hypothetical protein
MGCVATDATHLLTATQFPLDRFKHHFHELRITRGWFFFPSWVSAFANRGLWTARFGQRAFVCDTPHTVSCSTRNVRRSWAPFNMEAPYRFSRGIFCTDCTDPIPNSACQSGGPPPEGEASDGREMHDNTIVNQDMVGSARMGRQHSRLPVKANNNGSHIGTVMTRNEWAADTKAKGDSVFILSSPPHRPPFSLSTSYLSHPALHQPCLLSAFLISSGLWMASSLGPTPMSAKSPARATSGMRGLSFHLSAWTFRLTSATVFSFSMLPRNKFHEFVRSEFGLLVGMAYPDTDSTRLRVTADYMSILFTYDDLMDLSSSKLMHDRMGADKAARIMMSVLTEPLKFRPVPGLPVATAFHE